MSACQSWVVPEYAGAPMNNASAKSRGRTLRHHDHVAVLEKDVLFELLTLQNLRVVERERFLYAVGSPQDLDVVECSEFRGAASQAQRLHDVEALRELECAGTVDLAQHVDTVAEHLFDRDRHGRLL